MILLNGNSVNTTIFPDNTSQVWKLPEEILNETNYAHITWEFSHEGEFMQLAQLKDLLDIHNISATLRLPYLPYGRQDKDISNVSTFALITFSHLINIMRFKEVIIHDPHSERALRLIQRSKAQYPKSELQNVILSTNITLACYPDKGAVSKYTEVYKEEIGSAFIYGEKVRDQLTGNITHYEVIGNCKGETVLIVDDLIDGGATFKILAKALLERGAKSVNLFASHGIFSKGTRTLFESGISRIFITEGEVTARTTSGWQI